jgi:hypothetical protein
MFDHPRTTTRRIENFSGSRALSMVRHPSRALPVVRGNA